MAEQKKVNNEGYNMLARVFQERMQTVSHTPEALDFGEILDDYSLQVNKFPIPVPNTDYFVCRSLTLGNTGGLLTTTQAGTGKHDHPPCAGLNASGHEKEGDHIHNVLIPEKMRWLQPGDHVLVAWIGSDPLVIDIILPATEVK